MQRSNTFSALVLSILMLICSCSLTAQSDSIKIQGIAVDMVPIISIWRNGQVNSNSSLLFRLVQIEYKSDKNTRYRQLSVRPTLRYDENSDDEAETSGVGLSASYMSGKYFEIGKRIESAIGPYVAASYTRFWNSIEVNNQETNQRSVGVEAGIQYVFGIKFSEFLSLRSQVGLGLRFDNDFLEIDSDFGPAFSRTLNNIRYITRAPSTVELLIKF